MRSRDEYLSTCIPFRTEYVSRIDDILPEWKTCTQRWSPLSAVENIRTHIFTLRKLFYVCTSQHSYCVHYRRTFSITSVSKSATHIHCIWAPMMASTQIQVDDQIHAKYENLPSDFYKRSPNWGCEPVPNTETSFLTKISIATILHGSDFAFLGSTQMTTSWPQVSQKWIFPKKSYFCHCTLQHPWKESRLGREKVIPELLFWEIWQKT